MIRLDLDRRRRLARPLAAIATLAAAACATDDVTAPRRAEGAFTVDASSAQRYVYVSLADSAVVVPTPSAAESGAWDIAFSVTNVTLNGGEAGPGGVTGFCVCQNGGATNDQILAMTPESELADFEAVTAVPAGATFAADQLTPAVSGWFTGTGAAAAADPSKVFLVRLSDSTAYAKVHVTAIENPTATSPGRITLEYAVQPSSTAPFGPTLTHTTDVTSQGTVLLDLNPADGVPIGTGWDLKLEGFTIRVNGGVSGGGKGGAVRATPATAAFGDVTTAAAAAQSFQVDKYAGVFGAHPWYKYNLRGDNRISPTFDVYLVKRGSRVYKVQLLNYYGPTGQVRQISFRYEQIVGSAADRRR